LSDATCRGIARRTGQVPGMLGFALLLLALPTAAAVPAASGPAVQREIALIEFDGGGSAMTAQEKREAAAMVQRNMQVAPQAETAADAGAARLLQVLRDASPPLMALAREDGRLDAQLHPAVDPALNEQQRMETRIIEAHDPVVVFDPAHKRLISVQTLRVLQQADAFGAQVFGVPPPAPDFVTQMQQIIPRAWSGMDTGMQEAMAHAERDLPYAPAFLAAISPPERAAFVKTWRAKIMAPSDAASRQLNLAEVMAVIGMTAFRHSQSGTGDRGDALAYRTQLQDLVNRKMQQAIRSYSPTCNVTRPDVMQKWVLCHP
jgi:hypothetical protein